jgi:hypothetical protein
VARENTNLVRQMVKLDPKATTPYTAPSAVAAAPQPMAPVAFKPAAIDTSSSGEWNASIVSAAP